MNNFKSIFEKYGGNYNVTMERFMGKESLYLKILNMLPKDTNMQKLEDAIKNDDYTGAFEAAHTIKGLAGNLGLEPLYTAVCNIVEPLRIKEERNDYMRLLEDIKTEYIKADKLRIELLKDGENC